MPKPIKVMHLIAGLDPGGAQLMLQRLACGLDRARFISRVISLTEGGSVARELAANGIHVSALGMRRGVPDPRGIIRFHKHVRFVQPDLIQTWMYHADLLGGISGAILDHVPVIWGIHHSSFDPRTDKPTTRLTARACALLSTRLPTRIVCCSESALETHLRMGYPANRMTVIYGGIDTEAFKPDATARVEVRRELRLSGDGALIGMAARFHPQKDHRGIVEAMRMLVQRYPHAHLALLGAGIDTTNREVAEWIHAAGISDRVTLLGYRPDLPRLLAGLDIACLASSHGEAFPQAVGEAMACGVPCVVTDVGDSALMVGDTGVVVPARDPQALANGLQRLIDEGPEARHTRGLRARCRVEDFFGLTRMLSAYETLYASLADAVPGPMNRLR